ncbi:outer membrane protein assembly factor BamA [Palleronia aestuarii]
MGAVLRITASCLAIPGAAILAADPAIAQNFQFSDIRIEGNRRVDSASILNAAGVAPGQALSAGALNAAYQNVVNTGLFETVEIVPAGNVLVIRVSEWPTVNQISIEGNRRISDEEIQEVIGSVPRRVYSPAQAEADAAAIAEAYGAGGRLSASVTPRIIRRSDNRVDLVFEIVEGRVTEIERLSFVGNRAYSDRRLRRVLQTRQAGLLRTFIGGDTFVAERIDLDRQLLTDFYNSRGFIDFQIHSVNNEFARDRNAFFVQFNVQEGLQYDFGRITASSSLPGVNAQDFLGVSTIRSGGTYTPRAIEETVARMERLALARGLNFVRATPQVTRDPRNQRLDVNFLLEQGPRIFVERIDIEGNATTLDRVIRQQFNIVEGDPFNPREIAASAERIRALGFFADAAVEARDGTGPGQVIVDVDVEEQPTGSLSFGGSYSTDTGFGLNLGYQERNFLGRGQTLAFNIVTATNSQSSRFTFVEPFFFGRDLAFRFDAFYNTDDFDEADYNTRVVGFSPSITFPISLNGRLGLRYRLSKDTILDVDTGDPDNPLDDGSSPIIQSEEGSLYTSSVGYTYSYDTRRTGLDPNAGILFRFSQDLAGLGGDSEYIKTEALLLGQRQVFGEEITLRATLEGGAINALGDTETRVTDRFFLGSRQLRGFEPLGVGPRDLNATNEDALGGNAYAAARLEAEFPIGLPEEYGISGGVFLDAGSVWSLEDTTGAGGVEVDDSFHLRSSIGVSIFWTTPFGPLRFNFSEPLQAEDYDNTRSFNVTVSTEF